MRKPLCVELFCGTFGWSAGWLEMGGRVIGYDIEHLPHHGPVPARADLILQDVHTIDGRRLREADLILASPPCPEYSYMAMPWSRAKQIARAFHGEGDFPEGYRGSRTVAELTALFDACFRIQREASEAAGRHIPMVVENVRGAQPWVGRARANYGSFYMWGDVPALMPMPSKARKVPGFLDGSGGSFQTASVETGVKAGGSWSGYGKPGYVAKSLHQLAAVHDHDAVKQPDICGPRENGKGDAWFHAWFYRGAARHGSKSSARKAASARIAMIPYRLALHIAQFYFPEAYERTA